MKKLIIALVIFVNIGLFANPIIIQFPVISEFYYNQGNWQIELCIKSDIYGNMNIQSFDQLGVQANYGQAPIQTSYQFSFDSVYVIDQSWLGSTLIIDPIHDNLNIIFDGWSFWDGISYSPYPDTLVVSSPGPGESIAVHYFEYSLAYTMKQSPPTIGYNAFEVSSRSGISGYVYDQFQNPVQGISLEYYPSLYSWYASPITILQTDSNGYYESDEIFPMGYYVELTMYNSVLETDMMYFEPDTSYYKEYILTDVGISDPVVFDDIEVRVAPNPFRNKTTFHISMPDDLRESQGKITIRNMNGQQVDFIPLIMNPWASSEISLDWRPESLPPGLYIYSLMVDGQSLCSGKIISY